MLFPTHLLVAWLLARAARTGPWWVLLGATLPDAVDKPLATLGVVGLFHSVGHTALLAPLALAAALWSRRGAAIALGWASHLLADTLHVVLNGRPDDALTLGWPLVAPATPLGLPPLAFARQYLGTPSFWLEVGLWLLAAGLVVRARRRSVTGGGAGPDPEL